MKFLVLWLSFVSELAKVIYLTYDLIHISPCTLVQKLWRKKSLMKAERNYSVIEEEVLAIWFAIRKFQQYSYGPKFTLLTDHQPLTLLFGPKKDTTYSSIMLTKMGHTAVSIPV